MSGQDGNRGYLIQSVVAVLDSLGNPDWESIVLEPSSAQEKVDILWTGSFGTRAYQVKSSINQISLYDAKKWAEELKKGTTANELTLMLVGPCAETVARIGEWKDVKIPTPTPLNFEGLLGYAAHLLDKLLCEEQLVTLRPTQRELMIGALIAEFSIFVSNGQPMLRDRFIEKLKGWVADIEAPSNTAWELVDFSLQRGIESAISGQRLGPSDVNQCPEFPMVARAEKELTRSHLFMIVGSAGCGKSISAWQVAKKLHEKGYLVWRPGFDAKPHELLKELPQKKPSILVIDDSHLLNPIFIERLVEFSCSTTKILLASTITGRIIQNPALISPEEGINKLKKSILERRDEILPIVKGYDDRVGDKFMDISFEERIEDCARQKTPWEFFWVLRGGWQTAYAEFMSVGQQDNATDAFFIVALGQIATCDAGISNDQLRFLANEIEISNKKLDKAVSYLVSMNLICVHDDAFRTKHISYANKIVEITLSSKNKKSWFKCISVFNILLQKKIISFKGIYWLLNVINSTDVFRVGSQMVQPSLKDTIERAKTQWKQDDWAIGCVSSIIRSSNQFTEDLLQDSDLLLEWFTAGTGRIARFSRDIANTLINFSNSNSSQFASELFEKINYKELVAHANELDIKNFYTFGSLLDRLTFYKPSWGTKFISKLDWPRLLNHINKADVKHYHSISNLLVSLTFLERKSDKHCDLQFVADSIPFIVKAIKADPVNTIDATEGIFGLCFGLISKFLNGTGDGDPTEKQIQVARAIIDQLDPESFASLMKKIVSRDLEQLARTLWVIKEVSPEFVIKVSELVPENEFFYSTKEDWRTQSSELQSILKTFCDMPSCFPVRRWIDCNKEVIEGPLRPLFAAFAPTVAVEFFKSGQNVSLVEKWNQRWGITTYALFEISSIDKEVCIEIILQQTEELINKLYHISLDPPQHIIHFFKILYVISPELFESFISQIDINSAKAQATIKQLKTTQPKELRNYKRLAKVALQSKSQLNVVGKELLSHLNRSSEQTNNFRSQR